MSMSPSTNTNMGVDIPVQQSVAAGGSQDVKLPFSYVGTLEREDLEKYRVNIGICSVAYMKCGDIEASRSCAVLLKVDFDLRRAVLAEARVPLNIQAPKQLYDALPSQQHPTLKFYFPEYEVVKTREDETHKTTKVDPSLSVPTPISSFTWSGVGRVSETKGTKIAFIQLQGVSRPRRAHEPSLVEWNFQNMGSDFFPVSCKLLFVVESTQPDPDGTFPFKLEIEDKLEVKGCKEKLRWRPNGPPPGGWVFSIEGNYEMHIAYEAFEHVSRQPPKRCIGLKAAMGDYPHSTGLEENGSANGSAG